jgi:hypothetical protein
MLVRFHLERRIFHQERPHVVAQPIGMEMALFAMWATRLQGEQTKRPYLQGGLCLDLLDHDVCKRLVKLEKK